MLSSLFSCKGQLVAVAVDEDFVAVLDAALYDLACELCLDIPLQESLYRSCTVSRIVALVGDELLRSVCECERDFSSGRFSISSELDDPMI